MLDVLPFFIAIALVLVVLGAFLFKNGHGKGRPEAHAASKPDARNSESVPASPAAPAPDVPIEQLETSAFAATSGAPYQLKADLLALAFAGGATQKDGQEISFVVHEIGLLEISSGQVAASDPLVAPDPPAFTQAVPNGRHPVSVAIARFGSDERIAYARLRFTEAAPVRWEMARSATQDVATLGKDEFFGYGVDAGTGCFMDPRAGQLLNARMEAEEDYFEVIIEEMDKTYAHTRSWADIRPDPAAPENVICFSSGWGDGSYPSFFGLDAEGRPVVLVTDFLVT